MKVRPDPKNDNVVLTMTARAAMQSGGTVEAGERQELTTDEQEREL